MKRNEIRIGRYYAVLHKTSKRGKAVRAKMITHRDLELICRQMGSGGAPTPRRRSHE